MAQAAYPVRGDRRAAHRGHGGFTLVELLVVVVIIGIVLGATLLSLGGSNSDSQLEQERDRLAALINYVQERAALQTIEYGLRCEQGGYRFVMYDSRKGAWLEDPLDEQLRARTLPVGLDIALSVEDRAIVLPARADPDKPGAPRDLTPQVMLYSSGDLTRFKLTLVRSAARRSAVLSGNVSGKVEVGPLIEQPT